MSTDVYTAKKDLAYLNEFKQLIKKPNNYRGYLAYYLKGAQKAPYN